MKSSYYSTRFISNRLLDNTGQFTREAKLPPSCSHDGTSPQSGEGVGSLHKSRLHFYYGGARIHRHRPFYRQGPKLYHSRGRAGLTGGNSTTDCRHSGMRRLVLEFNSAKDWNYELRPNKLRLNIKQVPLFFFWQVNGVGKVTGPPHTNSAPPVGGGTSGSGAAASVDRLMCHLNVALTTAGTIPIPDSKSVYTYINITMHICRADLPVKTFILILNYNLISHYRDKEFVAHHVAAGYRDINWVWYSLLMLPSKWFRYGENVCSWRSSVRESEVPPALAFHPLFPPSPGTARPVASDITIDLDAWNRPE